MHEKFGIRTLIHASKKLLPPRSVWMPTTMTRACVQPISRDIGTVGNTGTTSCCRGGETVWALICPLQQRGRRCWLPSVANPTDESWRSHRETLWRPEDVFYRWTHSGDATTLHELSVHCNARSDLLSSSGHMEETACSLSLFWNTMEREERHTRQDLRLITVWVLIMKWHERTQCERNKRDFLFLFGRKSVCFDVLCLNPCVQLYYSHNTYSKFSRPKNNL